MAEATFVENDTGSKLRVTCRDNDTDAVINLTGSTVYLRWYVRSNPVQQKTMTLVDPVNGVAEYQFLAGELKTPMMRFEVEIQGVSGTRISSLSFLNEVVRRELG